MNDQRRPGPKRIASSISSAVAMPSFTIHSASRHNASIRRSATKPSISLLNISGRIPICVYTSRARSFVACEVRSPPQISTSGIRYTGLNGCPTTKRSGLTMSFWICVGRRPDVDDPKTVVGDAALLARASSSCFSSSRSGALSCTKSTPVTASSGDDTNVIVPSWGSGASVSLR